MVETPSLAEAGAGWFQPSDTDPSKPSDDCPQGIVDALQADPLACERIVAGLATWNVVKTFTQHPFLWQCIDSNCQHSNFHWEPFCHYCGNLKPSEKNPITSTASRHPGAGPGHFGARPHQPFHAGYGAPHYSRHSQSYPPPHGQPHPHSGAPPHAHHGHRPYGGRGPPAEWTCESCNASNLFRAPVRSLSI